MAKLRMNVEEWQALYAAASKVPVVAQKPCLRTALAMIHETLAAIETARKRGGDPRDAWRHDCGEAECAQVLAYREQEIEDIGAPPGNRDGSLIPALFILLKAECGSFFFVGKLADGNLAVLGAEEEGDDGALRRALPKIAADWAARDDDDEDDGDDPEAA